MLEFYASNHNACMMIIKIFLVFTLVSFSIVVLLWCVFGIKIHTITYWFLKIYNKNEICNGLLNVNDPIINIKGCLWLLLSIKFSFCRRTFSKKCYLKCVWNNKITFGVIFKCKVTKNHVFVTFWNPSFYSLQKIISKELFYYLKTSLILFFNFLKKLKVKSHFKSNDKHPLNMTFCPLSWRVWHESQLGNGLRIPGWL